MKLAICGSRNIYPQNVEVHHVLDVFGLTGKKISFLTGCAQGVDKWVRESGNEPLIFEANWQAFGKAAGPIRNAEIIKEADALLLIWDGSSLGSANVRSLAKTKGIPIYEIIYPDNKKPAADDQSGAG